MPVDVGVRPDHVAAIAAQTVTATKFYYYHDASRKAQARDTLRHLTQYDAFRKEDGMADVVLEQIWNQLVGNFDAAT